MDEVEALGIPRTLPDAPITPVVGEKRWMLFAAYYAETGNGTQSAIRAGYSERRAAQTAHDLLQKKYVKDYIQDQVGGALEVVRARADEQGVGEVAWIIEKAANIVEEAPRAGQYAAAVSALSLLARMHSIFNGGPAVDARSVNLILPPDTSLSDLRALRDDFQKQLAAAHE